MSRFRLTHLANRDLDEIATYIARDNPPAAHRLVDKLFERFEMLTRQPLIGESCAELAPNLRNFPLGSYVIYYQPVDDGVVIVRVVHGARDVDALFGR